MRTIAVVTTSRADYGIYLPILRAIVRDKSLKLRLMVSGTHLSHAFGHTVDAIRRDGFKVADEIPVVSRSDSPEAIGLAMARGVNGFAKAFARSRPDIVVVLGDRYEMHSAALAALPFKIPVAHIHGGELSMGAIDDALRHSMTKLSHLHFASTKEYAKRIIQLGEEPWRVVVSGAPALDNLRTMKLWNAAEMMKRFGLSFDRKPLLVTFHPTTLEYEQVEWQTQELLAALEGIRMPVVFTMPNADTGGGIIRRLITEYVKKHLSARAVESLGAQGYYSAMALSAAMVGNSSSGIIEAASLKLPVVNIGTRQDGRVRSKNVIDVGYSRTAVASGISKACFDVFKRRLENLRNLYGDGHSANKIVKTLKSMPLGDHLVRKVFRDHV